MRFRLLAAAALACTIATPALAQDEAIFEDIGVLFGMRGYAVGLMDHCHANVAQEAVYIEARDTWLTRNADALGALDQAITKLGGIPPADQTQVDKMISDAIMGDVGAPNGGAAYCKLFADAMLSGSRDVTALAADQLGRIKAMLATP